MNICRKFVLAAMLGSITLSACSTPSARLAPIAEMSPDAYRLGAGDEVRISVYGLDAINNSYLVSDTGAVNLPLLPPVDVAGKTVAEAQDEIARQIRARQLVNEPNVQAQITKYRPFFILGEVQKPGQYPYVPGMSVLNAVSIAGGYTFRAERKYVSVLRKTGDRSVEGRATPSSSVMPGDTITIDESWF